jgi:hypothetical protein
MGSERGGGKGEHPMPRRAGGEPLPLQMRNYVEAIVVHSGVAFGSVTS